MDDDLRTLERQARAAPEDFGSWERWRQALIRAQRHDPEAERQRLERALDVTERRLLRLQDMIDGDDVEEREQFVLAKLWSRYHALARRVVDHHYLLVTEPGNAETRAVIRAWYRSRWPYGLRGGQRRRLYDRDGPVGPHRTNLLYGFVERTLGYRAAHPSTPIPRPERCSHRWADGLWAIEDGRCRICGAVDPVLHMAARRKAEHGDTSPIWKYRTAIIATASCPLCQAGPQEPCRELDERFVHAVRVMEFQNRSRRS